MMIFYVVGYESVSAQSSFTVSGDKSQISLPYPLCVSTDVDSFISASTKNDCTKVGSGELKLFNSIPIKKVDIKISDEKTVIPCGTPFGVKLYTRGVVVINMEDIVVDGKYLNPAKDAGLQVGDIILSADGTETDTNEQLSEIVSKSKGKPIKLKVRRDNVIFTTKLLPALCGTAQYKIGVWVRDSSAGIGTMTFYDPETKQFGGLGHPVCDIDTGNLMPLDSGEVVKVSISGVKKDKSGFPGELVGGFVSSFSMGTLTDNTTVGLFGTLDDFSGGNEAIPLGLNSEIKTGKA